jgi:hypothetical protein
LKTALREGSVVCGFGEEQEERPREREVEVKRGWEEEAQEREIRILDD